MKCFKLLYSKLVNDLACSDSKDALRPKKPRERKTILKVEPVLSKFFWVAEFKTLLSYISTHANGMRIHPRFNLVKVPLSFDVIETRLNANYYTDMAKLDHDCREIFQNSLANLDLGVKKSDVSLREHLNFVLVPELINSSCLFIYIRSQQSIFDCAIFTS
jgi:hypothetical protein